MPKPPPVTGGPVCVDQRPRATGFLTPNLESILSALLKWLQRAWSTVTLLTGRFRVNTGITPIPLQALPAGGILVLGRES